jgi:hypothetical protein
VKQEFGGGLGGGRGRPGPACGKAALIVASAHKHLLPGKVVGWDHIVAFSDSLEMLWSEPSEKGFGGLVDQRGAKSATDLKMAE